MSAEATSPALSTLVNLARASQRAGASDIHLKPGLPPHFRIDGELRPLSRTSPLTPELLANMAWEIMNKRLRVQFKERNDADFSWAVPGVARFRVNVFRQRGQICMVLRTIPSRVRTIDELNLPPILKELAALERGLILVTGTTGSGKSTTLAAMIQEINQTRPAHVLTIEDPIEFSFRDERAIVNQREIGADAASFPAALRAALRQDPDVILVGEMRDLDTVEIALAAAETGHLVLSTVHSLNAPETINRIVSFFPPHHQKNVRLQLSGVLQAVISQRLVPRRDGGRVAALEIMLNRGSVAECISDPARVNEILDLVAKGHDQYGSQTFDQALYDFYQQGLIDQEQALRFATSPDNLMLKFRGIGADV